MGEKVVDSVTGFSYVKFEITTHTLNELSNKLKNGSELEVGESGQVGCF